MKKIVTLSAIAFLSTAVFAANEAVDENSTAADSMSTPQAQTKSAEQLNAEKISALEAKIAKLEKGQKKNKKKISAVNKLANKDNLKFNVDFRTAYDSLNYQTAGGINPMSGMQQKSEYKNDALYSMRLWLGMGYAPTDNMIFSATLGVNKAFGASYGQRATGMGFDTFDWIVNESLTDEKVRLREAFWLWKPTLGDLPMTVSVGRRPATNGYLINLRDDDKAKSPMGHIINMEFDGASVSAQLDEYVSGMYIKICAGRGLTNAASWANSADSALQSGSAGQPNYTNVSKADGGLDNTDLLGVIFKPYDDGQYSIMTKYYRGFNVPGMNMINATATGREYNMQSVGQMDGAAISAKIEGIGDEWSDFLDETIIFASYAWSQTNPDKKITQYDLNPSSPTYGTQITTKGMLGSTKKQSGDSYWIGTQMPNLTGGKFGLEYNHGSKYWRPFTYGEDTMVGSKMAVRGSAYEAYWTQPIIEHVFSMQVRYTYLDYDYTGSDGFFGQGGTPYKIGSLMANSMNAVETAQDIRVYFRYRY